jgi:hypothetical protein
MVEFDGSVISDTLGQIQIEKRKENSKKSRESVESVIQQVNHVDLRIINDMLVKLSLKHQITQQAVVKIQEKLPLVHKKVFSFELNENVEPSKFVAALMELYSQLNNRKKSSTSLSK